MTDRIINILLVDDHAIVREGYRALLSKQAGLQVVAEAENGMDAYQAYKQGAVDLVITDLSLPGLSGIELIGKIKQRDDQARILVFSMHQNAGFALQACRAGALGYVSKSSPPTELLNAIYAVHAGQPFLSADIAQAMALEKLNGEAFALETLTPREFEILRLLTAPKSTAEIAQILSISPKTVSNCHYLIKKKLGVDSDIELIRLAIRLEVINLVSYL